MLLSGDSAIAHAFALIDAVVVDRSARVPAPVFRDSLGEFCWMEFEGVLTTPFFECMCVLARRHGDRELIAACVDDYNIDNYGHSGIASVSPTDDEAAYHELFDTGLEGSSIDLRTIGTAFVFTGSSGRCAFVGHRGEELTVGAHCETGGWPVIKGLRYQTFDGALELASGPYPKQLPAELRGAYELNYRARSWPITRFVEG